MRWVDASLFCTRRAVRMCDEPKSMVMVQMAFLEKDGAIKLVGNSFPGDCPEELEESLVAMLQPLLAGDKEQKAIITAMMYCANCGKGVGNAAGVVLSLPVPQEMVAAAKEDGKTFEAYVAETLITRLINSAMHGVSIMVVTEMLPGFPFTRPPAQAA